MLRIFADIKFRTIMEFKEKGNDQHEATNKLKV